MDAAPARRRDALARRVRSCTLCERLVESRSRAVAGYGDPAAEILIVGEAPGRLGADRTGVPFTGDRSGVFLQGLLRGLGLSLSGPESTRPALRRVYVTNVVRCSPMGADGTNRPPTGAEIANCAGFLEKELEIIRPRLVVTLGLTASRALLGAGFSGKGFGRVRKGGRFSVLPLWHPAFVIRGGGRRRLTREAYAGHFAKLAAFLPGAG